MHMLSILETILAHTEHTRKQFHRTLSIRRTIFRVCSASVQILTVVKMDIQTRAEQMRKRFHSMLSIHETNFIACGACAEVISSHTEHTWKRFHRILKIRGTNRTLQIA
jgi:hypothetical protein